MGNKLEMEKETRHSLPQFRGRQKFLAKFRQFRRVNRLRERRLLQACVRAGIGESYLDRLACETQRNQLNPPCEIVAAQTEVDPEEVLKELGDLVDV